MRPYPLFQTLGSLAFILLIARTEAWQIANWPAGRVVHVHPWVEVIALIMAVLALVFAVFGTRDPEIGQRLDRAMPMAAWALLVIGVVGMAWVMPGPYAP